MSPSPRRRSTATRPTVSGPNSECTRTPPATPTGTPRPDATRRSGHAPRRCICVVGRPPNGAAPGRPLPGHVVVRASRLVPIPSPSPGSPGETSPQPRASTIASRPVSPNAACTAARCRNASLTRSTISSVTAPPKLSITPLRCTTPCTSTPCRALTRPTCGFHRTRTAADSALPPRSAIGRDRTAIDVSCAATPGQLHRNVHEPLRAPTGPGSSGAGAEAGRQRRARADRPAVGDSAGQREELPPWCPATR